MKAPPNIENFVKDECVNYDRHYQQCVSASPCKVLSRKRCGYFEKAVLCALDYKYKIPGYDYGKLHAQHGELTR